MPSYLELSDPVSRIRGIGEKKQERLAAMGIETVRDLLEHLPYRYQDRRRITVAAALPEQGNALTAGRLESKRLRRLAGNRSMLECLFRDDSGSFAAVFFNSPYRQRTLEISQSYVLYGRVQRRYGRASFANPEIVPEGDARDVRGIWPVYHQSSGISSRELARWVRQVLDALDPAADWLPAELREGNRLCSAYAAYRNIHFPESERAYRQARYRILYERLFCYQYALRQHRRWREAEDPRCQMPPVDWQPFLSALPFALTKGQRAAVGEIEKDLASRRPMNRLVQGDVGCGKTAVAEAAVYQVVKAGAQAAFMAPTEILARQHAERLSRDLAPLGIRVDLLVSAIPAAKRRDLLSRLAGGTIDVLVGTHALLQPGVVFARLGLAITDEQHRFGVMQRRALSDKAAAVNVLVMSATPIPRTLAATVYGDMDFSIIRDKPGDRPAITTRVLTPGARERAYATLRRELEAGRQAYVLAPAIEGDEEEAPQGLHSAEALYAELRKRFPEYRLGLVHGRLKAEEKEKTMRAFAAGEIRLLIATVVIEVGIDVPSATVMIVENAERFGLAQLHQLRGRVGRGRLPAYCYLINGSRSEQALGRMKILQETDDGFRISEEDYRLRGAGDLAGTLQHGRGLQDVLELFRHEDIVQAAGRDVQAVLEGKVAAPERAALEMRLAGLEARDNRDVL